MKSKRYNISLTPKTKEKLDTLSVEELGKKNASGWVAMQVEKEFKKLKK